MSRKVDFEGVSLTPISKAPKRYELEAQADLRKVPLEIVLREERERWYKARAKGGGAVQIKNPAAWERRERVENWQRKDGSFYQVKAESFYRPPAVAATETWDNSGTDERGINI